MQMEEAQIDHEESNSIPAGMKHSEELSQCKCRVPETLLLNQMVYS